MASWIAEQEWAFLGSCGRTNIVVVGLLSRLDYRFRSGEREGEELSDPFDAAGGIVEGVLSNYHCYLTTMMAWLKWSW